MIPVRSQGGRYTWYPRNEWKKKTTTYRPVITRLITYDWLVVSNPLKNISQLGWCFPINANMKNVPSQQPDYLLPAWNEPPPSLLLSTIDPIRLRQRNRSPTLLEIRVLDTSHNMDDFDLSQYAWNQPKQRISWIWLWKIDRHMSFTLV